MPFGEITYEYAPEDWSQDEFLRLGGFTVVFLNYNKLAQIRDSVASALNQDFPLLEMFFMDDASTDGSGEVMEGLVRQYAGRHKVTVVRNTENQRITGQWNIVSQLATGNWFGMFCADDIAYSNRVSQMAEGLRKYPGIAGMCSSGIEVDYQTGTCGRHIGGAELLFETGDELLSTLAMRESEVCGATAFWHKSLFEFPLPEGPYDDVILRWILQLRAYGEKNPVWLFRGDLETISYGVGTGTSAIGREVFSGKVSEWRLWRAKARHCRAYHLSLWKTWLGLARYFMEHDAQRAFIDVANLMVFFHFMLANGTLRRFLAGWKFATFLGRSPMALKSYVGRRCVKVFVQEFAGLTLAAMVSCVVHWLRGEPYRVIYDRNGR